ICSRSVSIQIGGTGTPRIINQTTNANSITVEWTEIPGAQFYNLGYRLAGSTQPYEIIPSLRRTIQTIKNLQLGQTYEIVVQALCRNNIPTPYSNPVIIRTNNYIDCNAPQLLKAVEISANEALLYFSPGSDNVRCYIVRYGLLINPKSSWTMLPVQSPENAIYVSNLLAGREYGFEVLSNCNFCSPNSGAFSAWSNTHRFKTLAARINALKELSSTATFRIYPNPNKGNFWLWVNSPLQEPIKYSLLSLQGKLIESGNLEISNEENEFNLHFENLSKGLYLLQLEQKGQIQTLKLIIE
ncbi:MAG: T9SS type A sorting domain-containing protein, partial [Bacteroidia bacterium]|nr:T9SS type A sorting domain-containing protein [Bacteroidia bacterium]MDW8158963.1 T9SS type A sorting domain-containing protein [Bacteroidia bacterium]